MLFRKSGTTWLIRISSTRLLHLWERCDNIEHNDGTYICVNTQQTAQRNFFNGVLGTMTSVRWNDVSTMEWKSSFKRSGSPYVLTQWMACIVYISFICKVVYSLPVYNLLISSFYLFMVWLTLSLTLMIVHGSKRP